MNIVLFFDLKIGNGNNVNVTPIIKKLKDKSNKFIEANFIKKKIKDKDEYDGIIRKKIKQKMYRWIEDIGSLTLEEYNFTLYIPTEKFICSIYDKFLKGKIESTKDINLILDDITELFDTIGVNKVNESISMKTVSIVENILLDLNIIKFNRFIEIDSKFYADKIRKKVFNIYNNPVEIYGDHSEFYRP